MCNKGYGAFTGIQDCIAIGDWRESGLYNTFLQGWRVGILLHGARSDSIKGSTVILSFPKIVSVIRLTILSETAFRC
jgi:hypothetical protein